MGGGVRSDGSTRSTWAPRTEPPDEETLGDKPTLQPNPSSSRVSSSTQQTSQKVLVLGTFVEFQVKTLPILRSPLSLQKEFAFLVRNSGVVTKICLLGDALCLGPRGSSQSVQGWRAAGACGADADESYGPGHPVAKPLTLH